MSRESLSYGVDLFSAPLSAMDMWRPCMDAAARWLPSARVCFGRVHVAWHLGDAVNMVRKQEHEGLRAERDPTLVGTKYLWLESPGSMRPERRSLLSQLKDVRHRTGRAWALKEIASRLCGYTSIGWARKAWPAWGRWHGAASSSRWCVRRGW